MRININVFIIILCVGSLYCFNINKNAQIIGTRRKKYIFAMYDAACQKLLTKLVPTIKDTSPPVSRVENVVTEKWQLFWRLPTAYTESRFFCTNDAVPVYDRDICLSDRLRPSVAVNNCARVPYFSMFPLFLTHCFSTDQTCRLSLASIKYSRDKLFCGKG